MRLRGIRPEPLAGPPVSHRRTEVGDDGADCKPKEQAMTAPNAILTNGRYELPPHARGVLVLADPPDRSG